MTSRSYLLIFIDWIESDIVGGGCIQVLPTARVSVAGKMTASPREGFMRPWRWATPGRLELALGNKVRISSLLCGLRVPYADEPTI